MKLLTAFAVVCVLVGCTNQAAQPTTAQDKPLHAGYLLGDKSGCQTLGALSVVPLQLGQDRTAHLDQASSCIKAEAGVDEPADLFKLPDSSKVYYVTVRTRVVHMMLMPRLELLDGKRRVIDALTYKNMESKGNAMSVTFFVRPGEKRPVYLLAYPDPQLVGKSRQRLKQGMAVGYYVFYSILYGTEAKSTVVYVEQGALDIRVAGYKTPTLGHEDRQ